MTNDFAAAMRRATLATRASNVAEATRVIQDALAGRSRPDARNPTMPDITPPPPKLRRTPFAIDPDAEIVEPSAKPAASVEQDDAGATTERTSGSPASQRLRMPLGETLRILREGRSTMSGAFGSPPGMALPGSTRHTVSPAVPEGAQFLSRSFTCAAGTRRYKLYIPASAPERPRGMVVMLHGCKQDPDDFAAGTGMNAVAEAHGLLAAYPCQTGADNASSCWNWFRPSDQMRDVGEPSIIAGLTREIASEFGLDRSGMFVAGLSAGGAMAAVLGETYPDLYAAVGVHSGLACGSANDVISAFSAMRGDEGRSSRSPKRPDPGGMPPVRTIVFHGNADRTVHPSNAERIVAAAGLPGPEGAVRKEKGRADGGRTYTRTIISHPGGTSSVEYWLVDGAGHAWSGGQAGGSYTDARGPDASSEMVRFFLNHQE